MQGIVTEVKEEIGIDIKPEDLQLYFQGRNDKEGVFLDDYYVKMDVLNIKKLELQEEEVESVHWFSEDEIKILMKQEKFYKNNYEEFVELLNWLDKNKI